MLKQTKLRITDDMLIVVNVAGNPKRLGSKAFARFAKYKSGMAVAQAKSNGITDEDLRWDHKRRFIALLTPHGAQTLKACDRFSDWTLDNVVPMNRESQGERS